MTANESRATAPRLDINNVVAAFSEEQIERMLGLSKSRLRYWARTDFFKPSYVEEDGRLPDSRFYAFKDVVALRTLERLRVQNGVPLQHLRKVAERLSHLADDLWTATTFYVANRKVIVVNPQDEAPREIVSGQYILEFSLAEVASDTQARIVAFNVRPNDTHGRISRDRMIARNAWVIAGTRVAVGSIKRLHEDGYSLEAIIGEYPDLTAADVRAALAHEVDAAA